MTSEITEHTIMKQIDDLQEQLSREMELSKDLEALLATERQKNKTLEHENHCLRVKVEQYRGKEEAFEFAFDKLIDKLGDR